MAVIELKCTHTDLSIEQGLQKNKNGDQGMANSEDSDMTALEQFDLGLHCLSRYVCLKIRIISVLQIVCVKKKLNINKNPGGFLPTERFVMSKPVPKVKTPFY